MKESMQVMQQYKIVLLARDTESASIVYNYLRKYVQFGAVIVEKPVSDWKMFRRRVKRIGLLKTTGQVIFIFLVAPVLCFFSRKRKEEIKTLYGLDNSNIFTKIARRVSSVNADDCRHLLKSINPDLVVVNGTRIISEKTLKCIEAPFINIHDGITPAFRGVHGGYWAMATGKPELFGTTIHYVDRGIDTGDIIEQVFIKPGKRDNFSTYPSLQHAIALPKLLEVIKKFSNGERPGVKSPVCENMPVRYHPTIFEWIKNSGRTFAMFFLIRNLLLLF